MTTTANDQKKLPLLSIAIGFLDCTRLDKDATTYLLLSQNSVQEAYEFSVVDLDAHAGDLHIATLDVAHEIDGDKYLDRCRQAIHRLNQYVSESWSEAASPIKNDIKWFVITEVPFEGNYYMYGTSTLSVISLANWSKDMAPPSLLEFILRQTQASIPLFLGAAENHYDTRGCIGDFTVNLGEAKQHVLIGHICHECARAIQKVHGHTGLDALRMLLNKSWIGSTDTVTSVAAIMKKTFGYDLYITKGFSTSFMEKVKSALLTGVVQEFLKLSGAVILAWALLKFGLKQ